MKVESEPSNSYFPTHFIKLHRGENVSSLIMFGITVKDVRYKDIQWRCENMHRGLVTDGGQGRTVTRGVLARYGQALSLYSSHDCRSIYNKHVN